MDEKESRRDQSDTVERREVLSASVLDTSTMARAKDLKESILIGTCKKFKKSSDEVFLCDG
jgi:hypothetical protein